MTPGDAAAPESSRADGSPGRDPAGGRRGGRLLAALLAVGLGLRVILVLQGGQAFFPDEARYLRSVRWVELLKGGRWGPALDLLVEAPDHTGWVVVGAVPALAQGLLRSAAGGSSAATFWLPALVLLMASLACVALVYLLSRRLGGGTEEALGAAVLVSSSSSFFYFSRHLLPYDASMALCLAALWCGLGAGAGLRASVACGLLSGAAFLTYNGYWASALVVLAVHVLHGAPAPGEAVRRGLVAGAASLFLPGGLALLGAARGVAYLQGMARFSGTVTQCDVAEGWSVILEYLWHAEHGLLLVLGAGAAALLASGRVPTEARRRGRLWLLCAFSLYALLVLSSSVLGRFCVYGRLARQVVPFLCLATASAATDLERLGRAVRCVVWATAVLTAAFGFREPLGLHFPGDFAREALEDHPRVLRDTTVLGPEGGRFRGPARYVLLNTRYLQPVVGVKAPPPGEVLRRERHPLEFLPYQYESLTAGERRILRSTDISMRLIDTRPGRRRLDDGAPAPSGDGEGGEVGESPSAAPTPPGR